MAAESGGRARGQGEDERGAGGRGATLPAPRCSREGGRRPGQARAGGTHRGGRRAARAELSRVPPRGLRAGGRVWRAGRSGAFMARSRSGRRGLGQSHSVTPTRHFPPPSSEGRERGLEPQPHECGLREPPTAAVPPRALPGAAGPGALRGRRRVRSGPKALPSATCARTRLSSTARSRDRSSLNHLCYLLPGRPTRLAPG